VKIIILGAGQVGRTAAYHLSREEANDVTVIDVNEDALRDLQDRLDIRTVSGNAASPRVLEAAGIANTDILVALTNSDEVNMIACHIAWTLYRTPKKIARVRSADYTERERLFGENGVAVDVWISPEQLVTEYVARLIRYPGALQVLDFADGRVRLVGIRARQGGPLVGQALRTLREHIPNIDARVAAIYRAGKSVKPEGTTVIEDGDEVFFLAARRDIRAVMREMRREEAPARRVVIAGGGNIGFRLARALEDKNQVKLIERDHKRARRVSEQLKNTTVLHGDAADEDLLLEENIDSADVFAALTNSEEANILSAMLAKRLGAHKVMALDQQAGLCRAHRERLDRHRDCAADGHDQLSARARAPRRRGARALLAPRRGRGARGRRARRRRQLEGHRTAHRGDHAAGGHDPRRGRARRGRDHRAPRHHGAAG
jgi:trk system potassium uptake protein